MKILYLMGKCHLLRAPVLLRQSRYLLNKLNIFSGTFNQCVSLAIYSFSLVTVFFQGIPHRGYFQK